MRCYRCGALMSDEVDTCPDCGFCLNSPVEIETDRWMGDVRILDAEGVLLGECANGETVYVDAPTRRTIRLCWTEFGPMEAVRNVKNGEAYKFVGTKLRLGQVRLIKTRTIPKRDGKGDT